MIISKDSDSVILRSPEKGDTEVYDDKVLINETRGGTYLSFRDSDWSIDNIFQYTFTTLTESTIDALRTFLINHVGTRITLTDHYGYVRTGYIVTDVFDIITIRDDCSYDVSFEFLVDQEDNTDYNRCLEDGELRVTENDEQRVIERLGN